MKIASTLRTLLCRLARALVAAPLAVAPLLFGPLAARAADDSATCPPAPIPLTVDRATAAMREARDHGFLWRISKGGHTSYLYGTIHAARIEWMFPGPTVVDAINASDAVALELDVLDADIQRRLMASIGPKRDDALPPTLVRRIDQRMAEECVDAAAYGKFAPEFQVASLGVMAARRDGIDPAYAIDLALALVARNIGKSVVSLETPEAQMKALQMPTQEETVAFVQESLDDLESGRARPLLNRIAKVWADGDFTQLSRYERWCDCLRTPSERAGMKRLLEDRNPNLAASIDALHESGKSVFAAVGSLHMIGPFGLPRLMRQRGYKVEQGVFAR